MASVTSSTGLASNIDTGAIVDAQINADRAPARLAEKNRTIAQARLSAVKAMNTRLLAMRDALDVVKDKTTFAAKAATSSNEAAVGVTVGSTAISSSFVVNVKKLAAAHQVATVGQGSATTDLGAGTVTLRLASAAIGDPDIIITPTTNTLTGLAEAINSANAGVNASVINDGGASPYRLVVTSSKTGAINAITTLTGSGGFAGVLPSLAGLTTVTTAADAEVRIGDKDTGLLVKSATNLMEKAIPGLSLNLKSVVDGVNITVSQDSAAVRDKVTALVNGFNEAASLYASSSKYDVATRSAGPLFGEYDIRSRLDSIQRELTKTDSAQPTGFQSLAEIGVKAAADGKMSIDAALFDAKLAANPNAVASLFLSAGSSASTPMANLTRSVDGAMALKQTSLETSILAYTERITAIDARLERRRAYYQSRFLAMEKTMASLKQQGESMTAFANSLTSSKS